jgi:D-serine deaminase-like pyridoxal phosphate-dependent protein
MKTAPVADLNMDRLRRNISRMADRARKAGIALRPHFKTHCSSAIGKEFRLFGVKSITVSSTAMGWYFARSGWNDITVAFVAHPGEMSELADLASSTRLGVLTDSVEGMRALDTALPPGTRLWVDVDCGYGRTGIPWGDTLEIVELAKAARRLGRLEFAGLLTHAGDSYSALSREGVLEVGARTLHRMAEVKSMFDAQGLEGFAISTGDTPTCSVMDDFGCATEMRPGNFVFNDLQQVALGSCDCGSLAFRVLCPVAAVYPARSALVLHCGSVNLSADRIEDDGRAFFGAVARPDKWPEGPHMPGAPIRRLSQEHASVEDPEGLLRGVKPGDLVAVYPVHSCLAAWQFSDYRAEGVKVEKMR